MVGLTFGVWVWGRVGFGFGFLVWGRVGFRFGFGFGAGLVLDLD